MGHLLEIIEPGTTTAVPASDIPVRHDEQPV
jgi:hypothetical protein